MADKKPVVNTTGQYEQLQSVDNLDVNGGKIVNVGAPTNPNDAATRTFVLANGLTIGKTIALSKCVPLP